MRYKLKNLAIAIGLATASTASYAAPQEPGIVITVEGTKVTAFWNPGIDAKSYTLYYAPYPALTPIGNIPMNGETDITVELPVGVSYAVAVKAKDVSGESDYSNIESFTVKATSSADANASVSDIISSTANKVVLASYEDFAVKAQGLTEALKKFQATPTDENLQEVQFSWRDTRRPWEQTEAFLFGPVDTQGLDPALDSWPVNRTDLNVIKLSCKQLIHLALL